MDTFCKRRRKRRKKKKKHNEKIIKDRIINITTLFELEEYYHWPKRVTNFWDNNHIEYESNGDKNRNLSLEEYLNKIKR